MKHKKIAALAAAVLMLTGHSAVFAAGNYSTKINGVCKPTEIRVTIPTTGKVYINPFELKIKLNNREIDDQIFSAPSVIHNESEIPLDVDVTVSAAINEGSDMTLVSYSTEGSSSTLKRAFLYFEIKPSATDDTEAIEWAEEYDSSEHIVLRTTPKTKKKVIRLAEDGDTACYGVFRLKGDCIAYPKNEWNNNDGLNVTVSFTFTPIPYGTEE